MKKGFTLIELLAVIIILAIVALIATPIILDVVEDARKSAAKSEASMILSGIQSYCATEEMKIQMNSMSADDAKCKDSGITAEDVKSMANLGNAQVTNVTVTEGNKYSFNVLSNGYLLDVNNGTITDNSIKTATLPGTSYSSISKSK